MSTHKIKQEPADDTHRMEVDHPAISQGSKMNGDNKPFDVEKVKILKDEKFKNGSKIIPDMNDPDPIIHEIPVFLAKELAQKLFLLQYPVRPCTMPYSSSSVLSSRFKPDQKQIELAVALDTSSGNFNNSKAEQIAVNVDGKSSKRLTIDETEKEIKYPSGMMDKQVLVSTKALDSTKRYAIGILSDQELHLTPLEGVLTLRNSLDHLDMSDKVRKENSKQSEDQANDEDDPGLEESSGDIKPVTVRFAKSGGDSEKFKKAREKSYEFQQQKARQEQWVDLHYNDVNSQSWLNETQKLFCKHMEEEIPNLYQGPQNFLESIK